METKNREVEINLKFCVQCGKKNDSESRFCIYCGHPFPEKDGGEGKGQKDKSDDTGEKQSKDSAVLYEVHKNKEKLNSVTTFKFKKILIILIASIVTVMVMVLLYGSGKNVEKQIEKGRKELTKEIEEQFRSNGINLEEMAKENSSHAFDGENLNGGETETESASSILETERSMAETEMAETEPIAINTEDEMENPMGIYYVTPHCAEMDIYEGDVFQDYYMYYICKSAENADGIIVLEQSFVDSFTNSIEMTYNEDLGSWFGYTSEADYYLYYDEYLEKYILSSAGETKCLENITESSAWQGETPEGTFAAELGTKNGLIYYIYDLFNSGYLAVISSDNSDEVNKYVATKVENWDYRIYPTNGDFLTRLKFGIYSGPDLVVEDWEGIYNEWWADSETEVATLNRDNYFDGYKSPETFSGTYQISGEGIDDMCISLKYHSGTKTFYYKIYEGTQVIASGTDALVHGMAGYGVISSKFYMDFTGENVKILVPKLGATAFDAVIK